MDKIPVDFAKKFGYEEEMEPEIFFRKVSEDFIRKKDAINDPDIKKSHLLPTFINIQKVTVNKMRDKFGVEIPEEKLKDENGKPAKWEDILEYGLEQAAVKFEAEKQEIQQRFGSTESEALKDLEVKYNKLQGIHKQTKDLLNTTATAYNEFKTNTAENMRKEKINYSWGQVKDRIQSTFKSTAKPLEIEGFWSLVEKNYKRDFDEEGKLILYNEKGEKIKSERQVGAFADANEILERLRDEKELGNKNPDGGTEVKPKYIPRTELVPNNQQERRVHPRAAALAETQRTR